MEHELQIWIIYHVSTGAAALAARARPAIRLFSNIPAVRPWLEIPLSMASSTEITQVPRAF
ncbi:MAG TPA: hypothetical protein VGA56_16270 [Opitutaceae bacterium]